MRAGHQDVAACTFPRPRIRTARADFERPPRTSRDRRTQRRSIRPVCCAGIVTPLSHRVVASERCTPAFQPGDLSHPSPSARLTCSRAPRARSGSRTQSRALPERNRMSAVVQARQPLGADQDFVDQVIAKHRGRPGELLSILEELQDHNPQQVPARGRAGLRRHAHEVLPRADLQRRDLLRAVQPEAAGRAHRLHLPRHGVPHARVAQPARARQAAARPARSRTRRAAPTSCR